MRCWRISGSPRTTRTWPPGRNRSAPSWSWPTSVSGTALPATTTCGSRRRTPRSWASEPAHPYGAERRGRCIRTILAGPGVRRRQNRTPANRETDPWHHARMAMTAQVKAELATVKVTRPSNRKAEIASTLRFAGGLHIVSGRIVIEAELDTGAAARRLRTEVARRIRPRLGAGHRQRVRDPPGDALRGPGDQGRFGAGATDRSGRRSRTSGPRVCPRRSSAAAWATARPPGAVRSWRTAR